MIDPAKPPFKLKIGTIVSLKSNPYLSQKDVESLVIVGDGKTISPLLVITEIFESKKETGVFDIQYKCIWYCQKSGSFQEERFSSSLLKATTITEHLNQEIKTEDFIPGALVRFKTTALELKKRKSSVTNYANSFDSITKTITPQLDFVSPLMQIIPYNERKKKKHVAPDVKTTTSIRVVKCKYFNSTTSKFSEYILPIESLELVNPINDKLLEELYNAIENNLCLHLNIEKEGSIVKPLIINYRTGIYSLEYFDYIKNHTLEISLNSFSGSFVPTKYAISSLPQFIDLNAGGMYKELITIESITKLLSFENKYWRIKYKDLNDKITERTIHNPQLIQVIEADKGSTTKGNSVTYLTAHCLLRNAMRHFTINGLQEIQVLNWNEEHEETDSPNNQLINITNN